ncbi:MAG: hypothetical protein HY577_02605 [Candidatus Nealsonbacteria bacterium]|nr:hypothetical protein [Candidatus Nealsonbacteria bacterium]
MENKKQLLVIIDAHSIIHRAFHALPPLTAPNGQIINAVYGFLSILFKTLRELKPDFVVVAFDLPSPTFRHQNFPDYKAKREKAPEEFYRQIPLIKDFLATLSIKTFEKEGFEADDLIGTIAILAERNTRFNPETIILSSDADVLQLVDEKTRAMILKKGVSQTVLYDGPAVREKYRGLSPRQLIDYKALRGDPSDNIPGVLGIGEKTAIELINRFQNLENIYQTVERNKSLLRESLYNKLSQQKDRAFLSRGLAEIRRDVEIDFDLEACRWGEYDQDKAIQALRGLRFFSLLDKLPVGGVD